MFRSFVLFLCVSVGFAAELRQIAPLEIPPFSTIAGQALELTQLGNVVYFITYNLGEPELWKTDGTKAGTQQVRLAGSSVRAQTLKRVQNTLYFTAGNRLGYLSEQGEPVLTDVAVLPKLYEANDGVFAWAYTIEGLRDHLVHFSIAEGARHYPAFFPGVEGLVLESSAPVLFNGKIHVVVSGYDDKTYLFATDGSVEGTNIVATMPNPESHSVSVIDALVHQGTLYFAINYSGRADERQGALWASDGTPDNTHLIETVVDQNFVQVIEGLTAFQEGVAYVVRDQDAQVLHLATASGSQSLEATRAAFITRLTAHAGGLLFFSPSGFHRMEAATAITTLIDATFSLFWEVALAPLQADEAGRFHIFSSLNGRYWVSDGTLAGTTFISENPQLFIPDELFLQPILANGYLLMSGAYLDARASSMMSLAPSGTWEGLSVYEKVDLFNLNVDAAELGDRIIYTNGVSFLSVGEDSGVETLSQDTGGFTIVGAFAYFWEVDGNLGTVSLWSTDGTLAHTVKLAEYFIGQLGYLQIFPSGNLLYFARLIEGQMVIARTDGTPEGTIELGTFADQPNSFYPTLNGDGVGGLFYVQAGSEHNRIWHCSGQATTMTTLVETPAYPLASNVNIVDFYLAAGRTWMSFADYTDGIPDAGLRTYHVWTSDGTTAGTLLYAEGVRSISHFRERLGLASFDLEFADRRGYVLSSGTEPFSAFSEAPAYYQIDGFDYRETGLRYGVKDEQLWVSDGTDAGTTVLGSYPGWLKPGLRFDTAAGTVLVLENDYTFRAYLTDGTAAGTELLFSEADHVGDVAAFDGRFYVTLAEQEGGDLHLYRLSSAGDLERVPGTESLQVQDLFVGEKSLLFYGATPDVELNLYAIDRSLALSYARKYRSQLFYEVSVEPIAGASSYEWSTQDGTLFHPSSSPKVMVKLGANRQAKVHLKVTLSDGQVIEGEVTIQAPDRPTGPIYFKGGPVLVNQVRSNVNP